jgi:Fe-S oxidoreductase
VAYSFWNTLIGPFDYLDARYPVPQHICEVTDDLIQRGALQFDKEANDSRIITFHDSCNVARASRMGNMPGGQFVIPRRIITSWPTISMTWHRKPFMKAPFAAAAAAAC